MEVNLNSTKSSNKKAVVIQETEQKGKCVRKGSVWPQ